MVSPFIITHDFEAGFGILIQVVTSLNTEIGAATAYLVLVLGRYIKVTVTSYQIELYLVFTIELDAAR